MLENVVPRYDWAGLKEAVIELQGPPSAAIQNTNRRGARALGAVAVQKQRPASSSVALCSRLSWVHGEGVGWRRQ